ncbi:hypothetical protein ASR47_10423 [Janthinobacterium psychrotolerans]|uniref:Uncharacterized protein n=1 Tax=Janthinobacterium psychrotolerans TaxID=1747903 RepID=A0A1A7CBI5_9BURK|nr:hypothetical protein ASR47_10423 [Janthinobacterium psychrotolerans]
MPTRGPRLCSRLSAAAAISRRRRISHSSVRTSAESLRPWISFSCSMLSGARILLIAGPYRTFISFHVSSAMDGSSSSSARKTSRIIPASSSVGPRLRSNWSALDTIARRRIISRSTARMSRESLRSRISTNSTVVRGFRNLLMTALVERSWYRLQALAVPDPAHKATTAQTRPPYPLHSLSARSPPG